MLDVGCWMLEIRECSEGNEAIAGGCLLIGLDAVATVAFGAVEGVVDAVEKGVEGVVGIVGGNAKTGGEIDAVSILLEVWSEIGAGSPVCAARMRKVQDMAFL